MLDLYDEQWADLRHAYGSAANIPALLRSLSTFPGAENHRSEPYYTLWSSLCHQGDVYSASYAALPHLVNALDTPEGRGSWSVLALVASIEIARARGNGPPILPRLKGAYFDALARIPSILAEAATSPWDELYTRAATSALAAAKGHVALAEVVLELDPEARDAFAEWLKAQ